MPDRERDQTAGKGRERGRGLFHSTGWEKRMEGGGEKERTREKEKQRETETGRGERGIYSGTGFLSAVSLTMLCKAKVVANFQIHYVYIYKESKKNKEAKKKENMT